MEDGGIKLIFWSPDGIFYLVLNITFNYAHSRKVLNMPLSRLVYDHLELKNIEKVIDHI